MPDTDTPTGVVVVPDVSVCAIAIFPAARVSEIWLAAARPELLAAAETLGVTLVKFWDVAASAGGGAGRAAAKLCAATRPAIVSAPVPAGVVADCVRIDASATVALEVSVSKTGVDAAALASVCVPIDVDADLSFVLPLAEISRWVPLVFAAVLSGIGRAATAVAFCARSCADSSSPCAARSAGCVFLAADASCSVTGMGGMDVLDGVAVGNVIAPASKRPAALVAFARPGRAGVGLALVAGCAWVLLEAEGESDWAVGAAGVGTLAATRSVGALVEFAAREPALPGAALAGFSEACAIAAANVVPEPAESFGSVLGPWPPCGLSTGEAGAVAFISDGEIIAPVLP